jgi:GTPase SAR1 family protein
MGNTTNKPGDVINDLDIINSFEKISNEVSPMQICMIGNIGVGKRSIRNRFVGLPLEFQHSDNDIDFLNTPIQLRTGEIDATIWTIPAILEDGNYLYPKFYHHYCDSIIVVFDITNFKSIQQLPFLIYTVKRFSKDNKDIIIVGNKADRGYYANNFSSIKKVLSKYKYFEVSALENVGINHIFKSLDYDAYLNRIGKN